MSSGFMSSDESYETAWGPRVLGLCVLLVSTAALVSLAAGDGAPTWTWILLSLLGLVSALITVANFGDRLEVTETGLTSRNVLLERLGMGRRRSASWSDVLEAKEYDGKTWFLTVEGQRRWVIDQLRDHERFRIRLDQEGVSVKVVEKPKAWRRDSPGPH